MAVFYRGERVRATEDGPLETNLGTIIEVRHGTYPYVVQWDCGGTTRAARDDIERVPAARAEAHAQEGQTP